MTVAFAVSFVVLPIWAALTGQGSFKCHPAPAMLVPLFMAAVGPDVGRGGPPREVGQIQQGSGGDHDVTGVNALTSGHHAGSMAPLDYDTDREMLQVMLSQIGLAEPPDARLLWIRNTRTLAGRRLRARLPSARMVALRPPLASRRGERYPGRRQVSLFTEPASWRSHERT